MPAAQKKTSVTVGLFGVGLDTYWPQFPELRERLLNYQRGIGKKISASGANLVDAGLVDNPTKAGAAAPTTAGKMQPCPMTSKRSAG